MNVEQINAYLERAQEIIGDRSSGETEYDDAVVAHLSAGMDIKRAIGPANQEHPDEALNPGADLWSDVAARYEYLKRSCPFPARAWNERYVLNPIGTEPFAIVESDHRVRRRGWREGYTVPAGTVVRLDAE
jgi:hypothetical protein